MLIFIFVFLSEGLANWIFLDLWIGALQRQYWEGEQKEYCTPLFYLCVDLTKYDDSSLETDGHINHVCYWT